MPNDFWTYQPPKGQARGSKTKGKFGGYSASAIAALVDLPKRKVWEGLYAMEQSLGRELQPAEVGRYIQAILNSIDDNSN